MASILLLFFQLIFLLNGNGTNEGQIVLDLSKRNHRANGQKVLNESAENTSELQKFREIIAINQMYCGLIGKTKLTAEGIDQKFKHLKAVIDMRVYDPMNSLYQFYRYSNKTVMVRGTAVVSDRSLASFLCIKTRSFDLRETEYVTIFFGVEGQIMYAVLSAFPSDIQISPTTPIKRNLHKPETIEKLINGQCVHNMIRADLFNSVC